MENYIILGIVLLLALAAVAVLIKHRGRKGCCGSGSDYTPRKKKIKNVVAVKVFQVEGMHCEKCAGRVTETINDLPDAAASVDLKSGAVTVSYAQSVEDDVIRDRIGRLGYTVTAIHPKA